MVLAERHIAAPADTIFSLLNPGADAGWLFDVSCDQLATGAVVSLQLPIGGPTDDEVTVLGRIARLEAPRRLDIVHDLPWRGRLSIRLNDAPTDAGGAGTRLRLLAELDEEGVAWLLRHRGISVAQPVTPTERPVGLMLSKSGTGAVFAGACEQLAAMALAEINADGGIRGQQLRILVGDDATDPATGALEARRLVAAGCRTILATTTSATFARIADELRDSGVLLVHTLMNEGGRGSELRMQLGERPHLQLAAAAGSAMDRMGGRRWFLAGNDYVWPRVIHDVARRVLAQGGATLAGEAFAPLGARDFAPLIERIVASDADFVLSSFVGADLVAFERQCHAMGVRERCASLALALDEPARERIGDVAAQGLWAVSGYFEQLDDPRNVAFLARYRDMFGELATPVSTISEGTYEAVHLYAAAARSTGDDEPRGLARSLRSCRSTFARGTVTIRGPETVVQDLFVAQAVVGGFAVERAG